jgi:hypothetical protein
MIQVGSVHGEHLLVVGEEKIQLAYPVSRQQETIKNPAADGVALREPEGRVEKLKGDGARGVH